MCFLPFTGKLEECEPLSVPGLTQEGTEEPKEIAPGTDSWVPEGMESL